MIIKVMARLKQILIGCLATIVILFLALKVTKVSVYILYSLVIHISKLYILGVLNKIDRQRDNKIW